MDRHMSEFQRFVQKRKKCEWSGSESRWNCQMGGQMESGVAGVGRWIGGWARDGTQVRRWVVIGIMGLIHLSRSEEHTSELQSHSDLVCRLLLEKKKIPTHSDTRV